MIDWDNPTGFYTPKPKACASCGRSCDCNAITFEYVPPPKSKPKPLFPEQPKLRPNRKSRRRDRARRRRKK